MTARLSSAAVMARRNVPRDGRDFYATPPWATRSLLEALGPDGYGLLGPQHTVLEPACGGGHMVGVLREWGLDVSASDKHDAGWGHRVTDFVASRAVCAGGVDWVITNPPFNKAIEFAERAVETARLGVALLLRTSFLEGERRWARLFDQERGALKPAYVLQFSSRVTMTAGGWRPEQRRGATAYAWFVWLPVRPVPFFDLSTQFEWFPPSWKARHTRPDDAARFAGEVAPCVLGAGG